MTPGEFDVAIIRRHLFAIDHALQILSAHRGKPLETLAASHEERWIVERGLQLCAQNALDVATHLAASAGHDVADYGAAIDRLAAMDVIPRDFAARFRGVAGFRNVIVHSYLDVDVGVVHRLLNEHLEDFSEFARHIDRYVRARSG